MGTSEYWCQRGYIELRNCSRKQGRRTLWYLQTIQDSINAEPHSRSCFISIFHLAMKSAVLRLEGKLLQLQLKYIYMYICVYVCIYLYIYSRIMSANQRTKNKETSL